MSMNNPTQTELAVWNQAKKLQEFRPEDLVKFGVQLSTAQKYIRHWRHRNWLSLARTDDENRRFYCALELARPEKDAVTGEASAEGNMWRVMRRMSCFTPTDVAAHANAGGIEVTVHKARSYCQKLLAASYLRVRSTAVPGQREASYSLVEDTGPHAPVTARIQGLLDPNTDTFIPADKRVRA